MLDVAIYVAALVAAYVLVLPLFRSGTGAGRILGLLVMVGALIALLVTLS